MTKAFFDLDEDVLRTIARSISDGIGVDFTHNKKQLNTYTSNSHANLKWDLVNTNLQKYLGENFVCVNIQKRKRGIWEFIIIFDKLSKKLITVMRESRVKNILKNPMKYKRHYVAALAQFLNKNLEPEQKKLFDIPKCQEDIDYQFELSQELCIDFDFSCLLDSLYAILSFSTNGGHLSSYKAHYLTTNLELSKEMGLQSFIPKEYDNEMIEDSQKDETNRDIPLTLKEEARKKKQENKEKQNDLFELKKDTNKNPQNDNGENF